MKTKIFLSLFICITLCTINACKKTLEIPKTGYEFARGNDLRFYYIDGSNKDLLNLKNHPLLPVAFRDTACQPVAPNHSDSSFYSFCGCSINYDSESRFYYFNTAIFGKQGYETDEFYIKVTDEDVDTLKAYFHYTWGASGGDGIYAYVDKLYYNGILITTEKTVSGTANSFTHKKIFILKENGKTKITSE